MRPYYAMKLKCFVLRLMIGSAVLITAVSIIAAIVQEIFGSYDAGSLLAYILGIVIAVLMAVPGLVLVYQAFHFEKSVFGRSGQDYSLLKKDMEKEDVVSAGNLVVTNQFVLLFTRHLFKMCMVIRLSDIIGCFENPVYETITKPTSYTILIYDRKFKAHPIVLDARKAESGHIAREKLCGLLPWIYSDERDAFMDKMLTKSGRRYLLKQMEKRRYQMQSTRDVDKEAETELNQLASEAKEKLNFHSILGRVKKKK